MSIKKNGKIFLIFIIASMITFNLPFIVNVRTNTLLAVNKTAAITITSIDDINETVYINDSYTLPKTVTATMSDGSTKALKVKWNSSKVKTNEAGETPYTGKVIGYDNETVNLKLKVIGIASIEDISESVYINDSYTFPKEVTATMEDGSTRSLTVKWKSSKARTSEAGETPYTGKVIGYDKNVNLKLKVIGIGSIENISESVYINDKYTLPKEVTATMEDGSTRSLTVKWKSSKARTSEAGETPYTGKVIGYDKDVNLKLKVIGIASIENISESVYINDSYTFPKEVTATMSDGSTRSLIVKWKSSKAKTNEAGVTDYTGEVIGYGNKTVNLKLTVIGIASIEDISETVDINDIYTLPKTVIVTMGDGTTKSLEVKWNTSKVDTSNGTQPEYIGTVNGHKNKVKLTLIINSIVGITIIGKSSAMVNVGDDYPLPKAIVTMGDGSEKPMEIKWSPSKVNTSKEGTITYTGTVAGYKATVSFTLCVSPIAVVDPVSVNFGDNYTLPTEVDVTMSDGNKKKDVGVIWDVSEVDTSKLGTYKYTGKLNGYMNKVKLELTVKEENPIKSVEFKKTEETKYSKTFNYASVLKAEESKDKNPIIKGVTLTGSASSKSIRLDIDNIAETKYNALYIDKNSNGKYDKGTDSIIGQFTITTTGKFANTYNGLVDGIKVVAGDNGSILFKVYNVDGSKNKTSITVKVKF